MAKLSTSQRVVLRHPAARAHVGEQPRGPYIAAPHRLTPHLEV
jgi:hypothetical protein